MKKKWSYNKYFFTTISFAFCCICFLIFYCQVTSKVGYPSDIRAHIRFCINQGWNGNDAAGYSLLHQLIKLAAMLLSFLKMNKEVIVSILIVLTLVASQFFSLIFINNYFQKRYSEVNPYFIDFITIALMVLSMIIINPFSPPFYLGIGTPNPWHNPTYIFCKPFSILVFIYLFKSVDRLIEKSSYIKELLLLSLFSVLSMWAKPSFMMSFLPSVAILFFYKFVKKEVSFRFIILLGISLLPSVIPLIITNNIVFNSTNSTNTIIFTFGQVWSRNSNNIPLSIILAAAFPLYVFILNVKKLSTSHLLVFINFLIAMMIRFFLAEKGYRMYHGNFSWGYFFALFFMFFVSVEVFFFKKKTSPILYKIGCVLFSLHLISGLYYLSIIAVGNNFL